MPESSYSFVYNRLSAIKALRQSDPARLVLAVLATLQPPESWAGCLVYRGESPIGEPATVGPPETYCIGTRGPGAAEVQERIIEALERFGVEVVQVYEGGPEVQQPLARASAGRWVEA